MYTATPMIKGVKEKLYKREIRKPDYLPIDFGEKNSRFPAPSDSQIRMIVAPLMCLTLSFSSLTSILHKK